MAYYIRDLETKDYYTKSCLPYMWAREKRKARLFKSNSEDLFTIMHALRRKGFKAIHEKIS